MEKIMIAVGGGVAAFKAVALASSLRKLHYDVYVMMTEASEKFITPLQFQSVTGNAVLTSNWPKAHHRGAMEIFPHLYPATQVDGLIVCPATADLIARLASGMGNDLVATSVLSLPAMCKKWICPSMNCEMYANSIVKKNLETLKKHGFVQLGPEKGTLACGMEGEGRLSEVEDIIDVISKAYKRDRVCQGKNVLVLSGPTREYIDPVRYLSNASSGKMGEALVKALIDRGAEVYWISGRVSSQMFQEFKGSKYMVETATDMLKLALKYFKEADAVINAAAVCDYTITNREKHKIKSDKDTLTLSLTKNVNILRTLVSIKKADQLVYGFALESRDIRKNALKKLSEKNVDAIVGNTPESLNRDSAHFYFVSKRQKMMDWGTISKDECAKRVVEKLSEDLSGKS